MSATGERAGRETLGVLVTVMGLLCIFAGPFLGYFDILQSLGLGFIQVTSEITVFYVRWLLLLIIGLLLRSKMIDMIQIMKSRRAIVYLGLALGLVMLGTLIAGLLREIKMEALIAYLPFLVNGAILMSWTKDLSKYR